MKEDTGEGEKFMTDELLLNAAEWYVKHNPEDCLTASQVMSEFCHQIQMGREKKAIFLIANISPRVYKMVKALKVHHIRVECIFLQGLATNTNVAKNIAAVADAVYTMGLSLYPVVCFLVLSRAAFVYLFSQAWNPDVTRFFKVLIQHKSSLPLMVFEQYDVGGLYSFVTGERLSEERYCFENADVVCDRGWEVEYLRDEAQYNLSGRLVRVLDACDEEPPPRPELSKDRPLTICYAGGIATEREAPEIPMACWIQLAEICASNNCQLHVYPSATGWDDDRYERYADYFELKKKNEWFYFHDPVEYVNLRSVLSEYDYGIHPARNLVANENFLGVYSREKILYYGSCNHLFDYLDAGIPVITYFPRMISLFFEGTRAAIRSPIESLDFTYLREQRDVLRSQAIRVQKDLRMSQEIIKLLNVVMPGKQETV